MIPKGILVYATGKTELLNDAPMGKNYVRHCECCGAQMFFDSAEMVAEDAATVTPVHADGSVY